jgi:hypothetical protein
VYHPATVVFDWRWPRWGLPAARLLAGLSVRRQFGPLAHSARRDPQDGYSPGTAGRGGAGVSGRSCGRHTTPGDKPVS